MIKNFIFALLISFAALAQSEPSTPGKPSLPLAANDQHKSYQNNAETISGDSTRFNLDLRSSKDDVYENLSPNTSSPFPSKIN